VLAGLVADVEKSLAVIWPRLTWLLRHVGKADSFLVDFSMNEARNGAWKFATELAVLDVYQQQKAIAERDKKIAGIGSLISKPGFFISFIFLLIRIGEIGSVAKKIGALRIKSALKRVNNLS
ncbi:MAG: DUF5995 family protein, partial [Ferruginibacter sp.]